MNSIDDTEARKALGLALDVEESDEEPFNEVTEVVKSAGEGL